MTLKELAERYPSDMKFRLFYGGIYFATYRKNDISIYPVANEKVIDYAESKKNIVFVTLKG